MPKHADDDPVKIRYSSMRNISFRGTEDLGVTWGEWRDMTGAEQDELVQEAANRLVDITVVSEED